MILIAVGEALQKIDRRTERSLLGQYPEVDWRAVMAMRNVLAHDYFGIDAQQVYDLCRHDIPRMIEAVRKMMDDLS